MSTTASSTIPKTVLFPVLFIPVFLGGVDTTLFNSVAHDLPVLTDAWRLWFIDGYSIALASSVVLGSRLGARWGPGPTLAVGLVVFALAAAAPACLGSPAAWTAARFVQGFGYALMISSVASVIGAMPDSADRSRGYSSWILASSLGAGAGPLVGRAFVDIDAYTALFWLPSATAMVCGLLAWLTLRDIDLGEASASRVDIPSVALAFVGLGLLVGGLQSHGELVLRLLASVLGCAFLALFCRRQLRSSEPLIDVRMLGFSRVGVCSLAIVLSWSCYSGAVYLFSTGASSWSSVLPVSALALWVSLGGFAFSTLNRRFAPVRVLQMSVAVCALGLPIAAFAGLWPASLVTGLGVGVACAAGCAYLLGSVSSEEVARAGALQETSFAVGAALGVAGFGGVLSASGSVASTAVIVAVLVAVVGWAFRFNRAALSA